jgi:hypothetical protein
MKSDYLYQFHDLEFVLTDQIHLTHLARAGIVKQSRRGGRSCIFFAKYRRWHLPFSLFV